MADEFVSSTSDQRTVNNTMRHQYRVLSDDEKAAELHALIASATPSRENSLAMTKVEEAVMWAVKHLTK